MGGGILTFSPLRPASPFSPGRPEGPWKERAGQSVSIKHGISRSMLVKGVVKWESAQISQGNYQGCECQGGQERGGMRDNRA